MFFQVFSRNSDVSGNPYRLILVYNEKGVIKEAYEARSSSPNICHTLRSDVPSYGGRGLIELISVHLAPAEYNNIKRMKHVKAILKHEG